MAEKWKANMCMHRVQGEPFPARLQELQRATCSELMISPTLPSLEEHNEGLMRHTSKNG